MGRHKSMKLPFLKIKLKSETLYSIFSLICLLAFFITIISFNQNAVVLNSLREFLTFYFDKAAIFFSVNFLFAAGVLIQNKRLKIIKPNWFVGYVLIFVSYLTLSNSGYLGEQINLGSRELISYPGTIMAFSILLLIGVFIFFQLSLLEFFKFLNKVFEIIQKQIGAVFSGIKRNEKNELTKNDKKEIEFVGDLKAHLPIPFGKSNLAIAKDNSVRSIVPSEQNIIHERKKILASNTEWHFPQLDLISKTQEAEADRGDVKYNCQTIEKTLNSFGIKASIAEMNKGPAVTQYALKIPMGINLNKITNLSNNLALALAAPNGQIRIEAPIPGKPYVGIEVPNIRPEMVTLRKMLMSPVFNDRSKLLLVPMGIDVSGSPIVIEIPKMPHILVAGTTGSGKSVMLTAWITTLLFRTTPDELGLILIDPKRVTFMMFDGIPHLMSEIITDWKDALSALRWGVDQMEERYKRLASLRTRDIFSYNEQCKPEDKMKFVVICIDELADLMSLASKEVENAITRIAQKARAVGIYLVIATQRPSVNVITGVMKANIPARVAFNVSSMIDSRVIIDMPGAEKLLGKGDMLFMSPDQSKPKRIQGPFVTEQEIKDVVNFLKNNNAPIHYTEEITQQNVKTTVDTRGNMVVKSGDKDLLLIQAAEYILETKRGSSSALQRRFSIGFGRAARILDELELLGVVGPANGPKPREVLVQSLEGLNLK